MKVSGYTILILSFFLSGTLIGVLCQEYSKKRIIEQAKYRDVDNEHHYRYGDHISFDKVNARILTREAKDYDLTIDYVLDQDGELHAYFEIYNYSYLYWDKWDKIITKTSDGDIHWSEVKNAMSPYKSVDYSISLNHVGRSTFSHFFNPLKAYTWPLTFEDYYEELKYFIVSPEYIRCDLKLTNDIFGEAWITDFLGKISLNIDTTISNVFVTPLACKYIESPRNSMTGYCLVLLCVRDNKNVWKNIIFCGDEKAAWTILCRPEIIITKNPYLDNMDNTNYKDYDMFIDIGIGGEMEGI